MSSDQPFEEFSQTNDLHYLSHRSLVRDLIPAWLGEDVVDLNERIAAAAYGETPKSIQELVIEILAPVTEDTFLDLGAGAGGFLSPFLERGISAFGVEQNPRLVEAGRRYLKSRQFDPRCLIQGDFLKYSWPAPTAIFSATSRFSEKTLCALVPVANRTRSIRMIATLGKALELGSGWTLVHQSDHQISWNQNEPEVPETLFCWERK